MGTRGICFLAFYIICSESTGFHDIGDCIQDNLTKSTICKYQPSLTNWAFEWGTLAKVIAGGL
jgi:hypothetical protein